MCSLCPSKPSKSNSHEKNLTEGESCGGAGILGKGKEGERGLRREAHSTSGGGRGQGAVAKRKVWGNETPKGGTVRDLFPGTWRLRNQFWERQVTRGRAQKWHKRCLLILSDLGALLQWDQTDTIHCSGVTRIVGGNYHFKHPVQSLIQILVSRHGPSLLLCTSSLP